MMPEAVIRAFSDADSLIRAAEKDGVDIAFLDICMPETSGIETAKQLIRINPRVNLIFVTGLNDYREEAMDLFASGYIKKPATREKIAIQLEHLRYPLPGEDKISVRTKGCFEVRIGGKPVGFSRKKTEELIAYLIYLEGKSVDLSELKRVLFPTNSADSYFSHAKNDLIKAFNDFGEDPAPFFCINRRYSADMSRIETDQTGEALRSSVSEYFNWDI